MMDKTDSFLRIRYSDFKPVSNGILKGVEILTASKYLATLKKFTCDRKLRTKKRTLKMS